MSRKLKSIRQTTTKTRRKAICAASGVARRREGAQRHVGPRPGYRRKPEVSVTV